MTVILQKASEEHKKQVEIIQDIPGWRFLGLTIFEERPGPIRMSDLLKKQGIHLTEEDIVQYRKLEKNSEQVPEIETLGELPEYKSLIQVWIKGSEFYVSPEAGEVYAQCVDLADFETGVTRVTGEYRKEILSGFNEVRNWMNSVKDRSELAKRLQNAFSNLRISGIVSLRDQGYSQDPSREKEMAKEGELVEKLKIKGRKGYVYISRPTSEQNLEICYGSAGEGKEEFWPYPNFFVRDIANQVTSSFQENGVPYIFRGNIYSPILIPLKESRIKWE